MTKRRDNSLAIGLALTLGGVMLVSAAAPRLAAQDAQPERPTIEGTWMLNRDLSDRAPVPGDRGGERGRDGRAGGGSGRGGGRGGGRQGGGVPGGGPGGGGGGRRGASGTNNMQQMREVMDEILTPSPRLIVRQPDAGHVTFVDADGHARTFATNGKNEQHQMTAGTVHTKTQWDEGQLVLMIAVEHGPTVIETWAFDQEKRRLLMTVKLDDARGGRARATTLTYDEADLQ